jgi:AraC-like DNA-binding protein
VQLAALVIREGRLAAARRAPSGAPAEAGDAGRAHVSRALALISEGSIVGADVAELAARLHLSPSHLRRLFRRYLGVSPKAYLEQRRLDRARGLLLQTDLPITTIAAQLGFARPQHFTAAFTVAEGVPPTRWRQQQRLPGDPGTPGADDARDATRGP